MESNSFGCAVAPGEALFARGGALFVDFDVFAIKIGE